MNGVGFNAADSIGSIVAICGTVVVIGVLIMVNPRGLLQQHVRSCRQP